MPALHGAFCPSCGLETLAIPQPGTGIPGLLCYNVGCDRPEAAAEVLADRQIGHVVAFTETEFVIRHPLIERIGDALLECRLHRFCERMPGPPPGGPGRYRAEYRAETGWILERVAEPVAGVES